MTLFLFAISAFLVTGSSAANGTAPHSVLEHEITGPSLDHNAISEGKTSARDHIVPENRDDADQMENDTLFVQEFVLALDVVDRTPVDVVSSFTMDDVRAWCFARIHNSQRIQDVYFEWYLEDELYFRMNVKVGTSDSWRTYSSVGLQPGSWRVVLLDRHESVLSERSFEVTE